MSRIPIKAVNGDKELLAELENFQNSSIGVLKLRDMGVYTQEEALERWPGYVKDLLNVILADRKKHELRARIGSLKGLEQERIAAQNPEGGVTIVSEWVPGSHINNIIDQLESELKALEVQNYA